MSYLVAFLTTLLIEEAVVFLFGFRATRDRICIALINGVTHPLFYLILFWFGVLQWRGLPDIGTTIGILEMGIIFLEFFLLSWLYPKKSWVSLFGMSFVMNCASGIIGFLTFF